MAEHLKPALVIGSGFHRHVFGISGENPRSSIAPLFDWHSLIDNVADELCVARPIRSLTEVMRWEHLLINSVAEGYRLNDRVWIEENASPSHQVEKIARKKVAEILYRLSNNYPFSKRAKIPSLSKWGCVISLNFDYCWHPNNQSKGRIDLSFTDRFDSGSSSENASRERLLQDTIESLRLRSHFPATYEVPRTWFPNGTIANPRLIRLGLRDYGDAPNSIHKNFQMLKRWEREYFGREKLKSGSIFNSIASILEKGPAGNASRGLAFPWSWVAEFLYRPLVIVGTGLSYQEVGLWWLLNQRARNTSRIEKKPKTVILVHQSDRREFWQSLPFGVEPIICENWAHGWDQIIKADHALELRLSEF